MTVSLPNRVDSAHIETRYRVDRDSAGLDDTPASTTDRDFLLAHLGRDVLHGSVTRDFKKAYRRNKAGEVSPRMYRTDSEALGKCEYVKLTSKQYAAVLVVDIDQPGEAGGHPADLALYVRKVVRVLVEHNIGPAWVGVNPISGKVNRPGFVRGSQVPRRRVPVRGGCDDRCPRARRAGSCRSRREVAGD